MANKPTKKVQKKNSTKSEGNFNSNLEGLEDFAFDEFSDDFEDFDPSKSSKLDLGKDFGKSAAKDFASTVLKKTSEKLIDQEFRAPISELSSTFGSIKYELNESIESLKRESIPTLKIINKVLPKKLKFLDSMIDKYSDQGQNKSREQQNEESIQNTLVGIFEKQAVQDKIESAEAQSRDAAKLSISKMNQESLNSIDNNISNLTSFNLSITKEFYRKSLEFQLRSFFTQREHLEEFKNYSRGSLKMTEAIIKNTSTPEVVKVGNYPNIEQVLKAQARSGIFKAQSNKKSYLDKVKERAVGAIKEYTANKLSEITAMNSAVEGLQSAGEAMGLSPIVSLAGGLLGGELGSMFVGKMKKGDIDNIKNNKTVQSARSILNTFMKSPELATGALRGKVESERYKAMASNSPFGLIKEKLLGVVGSGLDILQPDKDSRSLTGGALANDNLVDLTAAAIFDRRTKVTLTDAIPLYLSKILKENTLLRSYYQQVNTDKISPIEVGELHFDPIKRQLVGKTELVSSITGSLLGQKKKKRIGETTSRFGSSLEDSDFKKSYNKGNTTDIFSTYINLANSKGYDAGTIEELINLSDKDKTLKTFTDSNAKLKNMFDEYRKLSEENKKKINSAFSTAYLESSQDYPVNAVNSLLMFLVEMSGKDPAKIKYKTEILLAIAKALAHFYFNNYQTDITPDDLMTGRAFYYIEKEALEKVKYTLAMISSGVTQIMSYGDYADKAALMASIASINESIENKQDTPIEVYKVIKEFHPELTKLTATNVFENNFLAKKPEYAGSEDVISAISTMKSDLKFTMNTGNSDIKVDAKAAIAEVRNLFKGAFVLTKKDLKGRVRNLQEQADKYYQDAQNKYKEINDKFIELQKELSTDDMTKLQKAAVISQASLKIIGTKIDAMADDYKKQLTKEIEAAMAEYENKDELDKVVNELKGNSELALAKLKDLKESVSKSAMELTEKLKGLDDADRIRDAVTSTLQNLSDKLGSIKKADKDHGSET
jgi:hypothetical protein